MHEQNMAIVKSLVSVAWADGVFADEEKDMVDALIAAFEATDEEDDDGAVAGGDHLTATDGGGGRGGRDRAES